MFLRNISNRLFSTSATEIKATPDYLKQVLLLTLEVTYGMPKSSAYRQSVEALVNERLSLIEKNMDSSSFPLHYKHLSVQDLVEDAENELQLSRKMLLEWKPWLSMDARAPEGVWPANLSDPTGPTIKTENQEKST